MLQVVSVIPTYLFLLYKSLTCLILLHIFISNFEFCVIIDHVSRVSYVI